LRYPPTGVRFIVKEPAGEKYLKAIAQEADKSGKSFYRFSLNDTSVTLYTNFFFFFFWGGGVTSVTSLFFTFSKYLAGRKGSHYRSWMGVNSISNIFSAMGLASSQNFRPMLNPDPGLLKGEGLVFSYRKHNFKVCVLMTQKSIFLSFQ